MATRRTRHLVWTTADSAVKSLDRAARQLTELKTAGPPRVEEEQPNLDLFTTPRERAVYLLHVGAEVEHALMAQYLYAGYSLGGPKVTRPDQQELVGEWRATILEIVREEMGHLATVENLLTLIGGPLSFEREDYPIPQDLYPFAFELEPLTRKSLGKYVLAEMPNETVIAALGLEAEIAEIRKYVGTEGDEMAVHRVGIIYDAIKALFTPPERPQDPFIASSDIQAESIRFQVRADAWGLGYKDLLIESAIDRSSALAAIEKISLQGEGSDIDTFETSHFGKFLKIYRQFPGEGDWRPARNVARNPTTDQNAAPERRITNRVPLLWAGLFNLRYRMLLMYLAHAFRLEAPLRASGRTPRGLLVSWTFGEMYNLRSITEILMSLPMNEGGDTFAGPPFEMPYSLAPGARDPDRWRLHRDLLLASQEYVKTLQDATHGEYDNYLKGLHSANQTALEQALTLIGG